MALNLRQAHEKIKGLEGDAASLICGASTLVASRMRVASARSYICAFIESSLHNLRSGEAAERSPSAWKTAWCARGGLDRGRDSIV